MPVTKKNINKIHFQLAGNYDYDGIGNLIKDVQEGITSITWNVYGKIKTITKTGTNISYTYDASGNRISKNVNGKETWYVRDASGNVLSIYTKDAAINNGNLTQTEVDIYGSSRLGILNRNNYVGLGSVVPGIGNHYYLSYTRGKKFFELSNHLGNVLTVVSDRKKPFAKTTNQNVVDFYVADIKSVRDYYPFGMEMPGRKFTSLYRYGFNSQERSTEINENSYTAEYWQYDSRIGRRWNLDPNGSVGVSDFSVFANNPILRSDINGDTSIIMVWGTGDGHLGVGHAAIAIQNYKEIKERTKVNGKWVTQTKSVPDGTYTVRDLWPGEEANKTNFSKDLPAAYSPMAKGNTYTLDQLKNTDITNGSEGRAADGLILLPTTVSQDNAVNWNLDLDEQESKIYNGVNHNCSDYVASALKFLYGTKLPETRETASETLKVTTPNQVYKAAAGVPNSIVIKDAGSSVAGSSLEAATGGRVGKAVKKSGL